MKKIIMSCICMMVILFCSWSQDSQDNMVDTFIANFKRGNAEVKLQVIKDAQGMNIPGMGPLYLEAVNYIINNNQLLEKDITYRKLSIAAVEALKSEKYVKAKDSLWNLFKIDSNAQVRMGILQAMADIAAGDSKMIANINDWLESQNTIFKGGRTPDLQVIYTCIETLGKLGDPSSFMVLFHCLLRKYTDVILVKTDEAIKMLKGDFKQLYTVAIMNGTFEEKKFALTRVINDKAFSDKDKCDIAEFTLNVALNTTLNSTEEKALARETRYQAVNFLSEKKWSNSTQLVIAHFNQVIADMDKGLATKNNLIDAIRALGNMQNHEAANRLTLYLDLINSYTENGRVYDEQIVLAVIDSLKNLGDMVANGSLLYTKYLNYSDLVKKAATDAIKNLK